MTDAGTGAAVVRGDDGVRRCTWGASTPEYRAYHDAEWGRPVVDDVRLYEKLCLEGFQSGLSWITILRKRDVTRLLGDVGIVRHRGKIEATIANARATLAVQDEFGSLAAFVWRFEPRRRGRPVPERLGDLPAVTPESTALSKELRRHGFRFVGPTTAYAAMQSLGLVNDHFKGCAARSACERERRALGAVAS